MLQFYVSDKLRVKDGLILSLCLFLKYLAINENFPGFAVYGINFNPFHIVSVTGMGLLIWENTDQLEETTL